MHLALTEISHELFCIYLSETCIMLCSFIKTKSKFHSKIHFVVVWFTCFIHIRFHTQTCHSIFIENTEKLQGVLKAKVEGLLSMQKACSLQLGTWWVLVGARGAKPKENFAISLLRPLDLLIFRSMQTQKTTRKITMAIKKLLAGIKL